MNFRYIILVAVYQCLAVHAEYGLIKLESTVSKEHVEICAASNSNNHKISSSRFNESWKSGHEIARTYPSHGCCCIPSNADYRNKFAIVLKGNCKFIEKLTTIQKANGAGILIVSKKLIPTVAFTKITANITFAVITERSYLMCDNLLLKHGPKKIRISEYEPVKISFMDPNAMVIWFLAVFTVGLGSWFNTNRGNAEESSNKLLNRIERSTYDDKKLLFQYLFHHDPLCIRIMTIFFIASIVTSTILLIDYIGVTNIFIFCLIFIIYYVAILFVLDILGFCFDVIILKTKLKLLKIKKLILNVIYCRWDTIRFVLGFPICVWFMVYRSAHLVWIVEDLMVFSFCFNILRVSTLASLKVSSIMLVGSVLFELFLINIQLMYETDTNSLDGSEDLKHVLDMIFMFKLPRFVITPIDKCAQLPYSMLPFLNVLIPGLHVTACVMWDYHASITTGVKTHSYYLSALTGYGIGLGICIANAILSLSEPVSLYVVPCCLLSTVLVAIMRNELGDIWNGDIRKPIYQEKINKIAAKTENVIYLV